jgi:hypothetical protein
MTVYVDPIFSTVPVDAQAKSHGSKWCHMIATSQKELHEMAKKIGLKRGYYQPHALYPHYDLVPSKRGFTVRGDRIKPQG